VISDQQEIDVRTPAPRGEPDALVSGYAGVVLEVADPERSRRFYADVGVEPDLVEQTEPRVSPEGGAHVAFGVPPGQLAALERRFHLSRYHEDRPSERDLNRYLTDPDGNRIQLVEAFTPRIDHVALETHDLEWAELFWVHLIGGRVEGRVGWAMDDFTRAHAWGAGEDDCAPGTRRWDKRYTDIDGQARVPRPNAQVFVTLARGVTLVVYLATQHVQEPPPNVFVGTPRVRFRLSADGLPELERRFQTLRLRCLHRSPATGYPYEIHDGSLFTKDPGGNFLEFAP
jgi:catechol 2,3-dioxygenase-like lactoylglutathione lyase family enzyme